MVVVLVLDARHEAREAIHGVCFLGPLPDVVDQVIAHVAERDLLVAARGAQRFDSGIFIRHADFVPVARRN